MSSDLKIGAQEPNFGFSLPTSPVKNSIAGKSKSLIQSPVAASNAFNCIHDYSPKNRRLQSMSTVNYNREIGWGVT